MYGYLSTVIYTELSNASAYRTILNQVRSLQGYSRAYIASAVIN